MSCVLGHTVNIWTVTLLGHQQVSVDFLGGVLHRSYSKPKPGLHFSSHAVICKLLLSAASSMVCISAVIFCAAFWPR